MDESVIVDVEHGHSDTHEAWREYGNAVNNCLAH